MEGVDEVLKSILQLPRSAQNHPFTQLCHRCRYLSAEERDEALLILAQHAVKFSAGPQAIRILMRNFIDRGAGAAPGERLASQKRVRQDGAAQTALEVLSDSILFMGIAEQYEPLSMLASSVFYFARDKQQQRFKGILDAWGNMVSLMPKALLEARDPTRCLRNGLFLISSDVSASFLKTAGNRIDRMAEKCAALRSDDLRDTSPFN